MSTHFPFAVASFLRCRQLRVVSLTCLTHRASVGHGDGKHLIISNPVNSTVLVAVETFVQALTGTKDQPRLSFHRPAGGSTPAVTELVTPAGVPQPIYLDVAAGDRMVKVGPLAETYSFPRPTMWPGGS